jgi:hypothetical protein
MKAAAPQNSNPAAPHSAKPRDHLGIMVHHPFRAAFTLKTSF